MFQQVLLVATGGAIGSAARYLVSVGAVRVLGAGFPYGTLFVNLVGSFLIAVVHQLGAAAILSPEVRLFLATGVMGGFTTYSAFTHETLSALALGAWPTAATNILLTVLGCLAGGLLGVWVGRALGG